MAYDETRTDIDHLAIAVEQLEVAIELFLNGRSFASAVTLAGAADGVFQKALEARKEQTSLETSFEATDSCRQLRQSLVRSKALWIGRRVSRPSVIEETWSAICSSMGRVNEGTIVIKCREYIPICRKRPAK